MSVVVSLAALLAFQVLGTALERLLHIPVPGPVIGMFLLLCALFLDKRVEGLVRTSATGLVGMLTLLFVPACAGIITQGERLARGGVAIVASIVASSLIAMAVTAWVMQAVKRWQDRRAAGGRDAA